MEAGLVGMVLDADVVEAQLFCQCGEAQRPRRIRFRDKEVAEKNRPSVVSDGAISFSR